MNSGAKLSCDNGREVANTAKQCASTRSPSLPGMQSTWERFYNRGSIEKANDVWVAQRQNALEDPNLTGKSFRGPGASEG